MSEQRATTGVMNALKLDRPGLETRSAAASWVMAGVGTAVSSVPPFPQVYNGRNNSSSTPAVWTMGSSGQNVPRCAWLTLGV